MDKQHFEQDRNERKRREERHLRRIELVKSVAIVLLAVVLLAQIAFSGLFSLVFDDLFAALRSGGADPVVNHSEFTTATTPVRFSLYNETSRHSVQYDDAALARLAAETEDLLHEAIGSAGVPAEVSRSQYEAAFSLPGIWFDYPGNIPLHAVVSWSEVIAERLPLSVTVSALLLALQDGVTMLYYMDADTGLYYAAATAVRAEDLLGSLERTDGGNSIPFAFETDSFSMLLPETLLPALPPRPPQYTVVNPLQGSALGTVLAALSFPEQSSYSSSGAQVYRDKGDTLRITDSGAIYYETMGDSTRYPAMDNLPAAIETCRRLAQRSLGDLSGAAHLHLLSIEAADDGYALYFGYTLNGSLVYLGTTGYAARFLIQSGELRSFLLRPRSYLETGEASLVLPLHQAVAVLNLLPADGPSALELVYRSNDSGMAQANWEAGREE